MTGRRGSPLRFWFVAGVAGAMVLAAVGRVAGLPFYLSWLAGASAGLMFLYGFDKRRGARGGRRVPEVALHALALAGGFAGGWAGRRLFRHKIRRAGFAVVLVVAAALHGAIVVFMYL